MRKTKSQFSLIVSNLTESTKLTDTSGNPKESYHWRHMAAVRGEWQHEFRHPNANALEPTLIEIMRIETQVRKELYP